MSYRMIAAKFDSQSAAQTRAKFQADVQTFYGKVEKSIGIRVYSKNLYKHFQSLSSEIGTSASASKKPKFIGSKKDVVNVTKCYREISHDLKTLNVNEDLAFVENALLSFKLRIHEIEKVSDGMSLELSEVMEGKKKDEWNTSFETFAGKYSKLSDRFAYLQQCAGDNYELCANQLAEILPKVRNSKNARLQYDAIKSRVKFFSDSLMKISALRKPCLKLSEDVRTQLSRPASEGKEDLFIAEFEDVSEATTILAKLFHKRLAIQRKWSRFEFKGKKSMMCIHTANRYIKSIHLKTTYFFEMIEELQKDYFHAKTQANHKIFVRLASDKVEMCLAKVKVAEEAVFHANRALDLLVQTDIAFQPSTSGSSSTF